MSQEKVLSRAVISKKQPLEELIEENISLNRENCLLRIGVICLSIFSALSIGSCRRNANELRQTCLKNTELKETASHFQKDAAHLAIENQKLKPYRDFVDSIQPFSPDTVTDLKDEKEEKEMTKQNIEGQRKWENAFKTLGVDALDYLYLKSRDI